MAISPIFIILPTIYFLPRYIDYQDPETIFYLRVVFIVVHALLFGVALYIQNIIKNKPNNSKVFIPAPQPGFMARFVPQEPVEARTLTVAEYDAEEISNYMSGMLKTLGIIAFLHFQMGVVPPLVVQCISNSLSLFQGPLFAIHVLGSTDPEVLKRPFKAAGSFEAPAAPAAENSLADGSDDEGEDSTSDDASKKKKKSQKKNKASNKKQD